ncbi:MAG: magnesium-translocating P-type ATPase [Proteobacteria bacterium]|nr:magnesium-translocating P-type ATPase [Pseudomonadota bacterium]
MVGQYWVSGSEELFKVLGSSASGLSPNEALARLRECGANELREGPKLTRLGVLGNQLNNPLLWLLVFASIASVLAGQWLDASIVILILVASVAIGYSREYSAQRAAAGLYAKVMVKSRVIRDGGMVEVPAREVVPGDVLFLSAGSLVPADAVLISATDFFVNEAVLTGESFPVHKTVGKAEPQSPLRERGNCVFAGSNVRSGTAHCLVVHTAKNTYIASIAYQLTVTPPETEFDRGFRRFGYLLVQVMLVIVLTVFAVNMLRHRPPLETLLFSVALAVGLTPELLPAILRINLARGAKLMAAHGVLVKRLNAIENLGSMDILCTDKTGTLTEGVVKLDGAFDLEGQESATVLELASINAALETGLPNPLDEAILHRGVALPRDAEKRAEVPFDFTRKRLSVVVRRADTIQLITKGSFRAILEVCTHTASGAPLDADKKAKLEALFSHWSSAGTRVIAVATRRINAKARYTRDDECGMQFEGFLTFLDRPKKGVATAIAELLHLGVAVKIITGDNREVTQHVAHSVGMRAESILSGQEIAGMDEYSLWRKAESTELFVEVDPHQKERIIRALKKVGHVVGFMGDGINDAPAMHVADTSISVEDAVDVAKAAADFVLLEQDLDVIRRGIEEGRRTFANTLKYIQLSSSANFGNMLSMAIASLALPFLPLQPGQILLNNFLADIPAFGLADDSVDPETVAAPERWDIRTIARFMLLFGLISSVFDFATFAVLLVGFHAMPHLFQTGWWVESLLTQLIITFVVRTRRRSYQSTPAPFLLWSTATLIVLTLLIPFIPGAEVFGFIAPPRAVLYWIIAILCTYACTVEVAKFYFYRRYSRVHS